MLTVIPRCRLVIDNDWSGDPDGLLALAHHLLSPSNRVDAVTGSFTNPIFPGNSGSAVRGAGLAADLIALTRIAVPGGSTAGPDDPFTGAVRTSAAASAIITAARADDALPLIVVCCGPLTNVADALLAAPEIADRMTLVWVGGSDEPEGFEYNRDTDRAAADFVFAHPSLTISWFPVEVYRHGCTISLTELRYELSQCGELGTWMWERFDTMPIPPMTEPVWALGDSLPVVVTALNLSPETFRIVGENPARTRFVAADARLIIGDMVSKLRLHAAG